MEAGVYGSQVNIQMVVLKAKDGGGQQMKGESWSWQECGCGMDDIDQNTVIS